VPLMRCTRSGRSGWKWGESGTCYIGKNAKANAARQGRAIEAAKGRRDARVKAPPPKSMYPWKVEESYNRWILKRTRAMNALTSKALIAELQKLKPEIDERAKERGRRVDTAGSDTRTMMKAVTTTQHRWGAAAASRVERKQLELFAKGVDAIATANTERQVLSVLAIDVGFTHGSTSAAHRAWVARNVKLIKTVDQRYFSELQAIIRQGVAEGRTTKYITEQVAKRGHVSQTNATRIARTEIGKLNSQITKGRHEDLGIKKYTWMTVGDDRVRDGSEGPADHVALDGTPHKWDEPPFDGAENVHPGMAINCFVPGTKVEGSVVGGARSTYKGRVIEIETRRGHVLRVTPHHPILTPEGWLEAQELHEGDQVLSKVGSDEPTRDVDPDHGPVDVEEVFGALLELWGVSSTTLQPDDLHGDAVGVQGDVDVANAPCTLLCDGEVGAKLIRDLLLALAESGDGVLMREGALDLRLLGLRYAPGGLPGGAALTLDTAGGDLDPLPLEGFRLGAGADMNSAVGEMAADLGSAQAEILAQLQRRLAGLVSFNYLTEVGDMAVAPNGHRLGWLARLDAALGHAAVDDLDATPEAVSDVLGRLSGLVSGDEVVRVGEVEFAGHVYDLQTVSGAMVAGNIIVSNCRCFPVPLISKETEGKMLKSVEEDGVIDVRKVA